ncbi:HNH endonuclease [Bacillus marinisedimentorum]|uniref:HNH endonuclease n=1 Tax=Bacillus marinisedimentorum TaxID=1821260 RepID=UPI000871C7FB|nr:HNH endonuclease [Bacillus marinisedimentorum]
MGPKGNSSGTCELCGRSGVQTTVHHLTPKEKGGTFLPAATLCIPCHKQVHALFSNEELAAALNTIGALQRNEHIQKYLKWIRKQPPARVPRTKKSLRKKR